MRKKRTSSFSDSHSRRDTHHSQDTAHQTRRWDCYLHRPHHYRPDHSVYRHSPNIVLVQALVAACTDADVDTGCGTLAEIGVGGVEECAVAGNDVVVWGIADNAVAVVDRSNLRPHPPPPDLDDYFSLHIRCDKFASVVVAVADAPGTRRSSAVD